MNTILLAVGLLFTAPQDEKVKKLVAKADELWAQREQIGMAAQAVETYQKAIALDEGCVDAYWKISRTFFWTGSHEKDEEKRSAIFREGIENAKKAVALDENSVGAHFWLGVMYGLFGEAKGIGQSLDLIEPIKKEMGWVLKTDETFNFAGAHRVLGRLYYKLPGIKGGDNKISIDHLRRAVELSPDLLDNRLFLAEVYADEGMKEEAKKELRVLLDSKDNAVWGPESRESKEKAKVLLKELEG